MPYYAVKIGKIPGIYKTWSECKENIKDVEKATFKKFETETEANQFLKKKYESKHKIFSDNKIYSETFDLSDKVCGIAKKWTSASPARSRSTFLRDNTFDQSNDVYKIAPVWTSTPKSTTYNFVDNVNEKKEIVINTKNLSIENDHVVNRNHDFSSSINIYLNSIYLGENGDMKSIGSISIYFGSDDTRNELRKLEYDKYKDMTSDTVLFKSVLVAFNKVITEIVEEKSIILHTNSIDCIKYLTNDLVYAKNLSSYELVAKGHMIINKYPNIKFYHNKSSYCTEWIHDINIFETKRLNLENLKKYYDKMVFIFGKFKNCSFGKIFNSNPDYFDWCLINCKLQINEIRLFLESKND